MVDDMLGASVLMKQRSTYKCDRDQRVASLMKQGKYRLQEIKLTKCVPDDAPHTLRDPLHNEEGESRDQEISLLNLTVKHMSTSYIKQNARKADPSTITSDNHHVMSKSSLGPRDHHPQRRLKSS